MTNDDFNADAQSDKKVASDGSGTTRRTVLKGATATAAGLTLGSSMVGNSMAQAGQGVPTPKLEREGNKLVDECGNEVVLRGVNIVDPARANRGWRGATADEMIEMATANTDWPNTVIRLPMQPQDISAAPDRSGGNESHHIHGDNWGPALPVAFTKEELDTYLERFVDPLVDMAAKRGFYIQMDYHRHYPIFHQAQYEDEVSEWQRCGNETFEHDYGMCGERGVLWHGADQVDEIQSLDGSPDDAYFETQSSEVNNSNAANVAEAFDEEMTMFWDVVAERYADEPHVIFEPYNEPTAPGIWGPAEGGCGYAKQIPLWETFRQDFAAPIMEQVREHAPDKLMLMGLPGWCQATQALHWGGLDEEGFDNVAAVWHNYAGHSASKQKNWLNDTDYGGDACNGWEPEESQGLQNAMDVHHIHVTEFGWQDPGYTEDNIEGSVNISKWLRGSTTGQGSTEAYGKPFLEAMETDERISWVAWCADARWLPAMFQTDFPINETTFDLENGSWYETPESEYPINCEELPCDWKLWDNPNMGVYVKQTLAEKAEDNLPFDLVETTGGTDNNDDQDDNDQTGGPTYPEGATDPDGDGYYEDLNGNGETDYSDVVEYFNNMENEQFQSNAEYYDYNGNGGIDYADLVELFNEI